MPVSFQGIGDPMELPSEGSQLGNGTPESQEFVLGQGAETSEMGPDQHADVRRRTHSACKGASLEQQRILGTEAHVKAVLPVPRPLLRLTAHEIKGLGRQRPNGYPPEPRRRRHELGRRRGLDAPLDVRGHGRVQELPFVQWSLLQVVFQF